MLAFLKQNCEIVVLLKYAIQFVEVSADSVDFHLLFLSIIVEATNDFWGFKCNHINIPWAMTLATLPAFFYYLLYSWVIKLVTL